MASIPTAKDTRMTSAANHQPPATNPQPPEEWRAFITNRWSRIVVQPLLITVMFTAFIAGPLTVLQIIVPAAPWHLWIFVFFFLILETVYTTLWLKRPGQRGLSHLAYRAAEFLVFIVLLRLLAWSFTGSWPDQEAWQAFLFEPLTLFADGFFLVAAFAIFLVWQMVIRITDLFSELALDQAEAAYYADVFGKHKFDSRPYVIDRSQLINAFLQQWLAGGLILVICAALSTFDLLDPAVKQSVFSIARLPLPQSMLLSLIVYFLAGFLLLSQGRLALLNARWLINGVQKNERLERSWYRFSLRLLILVAFVAALLPLGSTIALGQIVLAIFQGVMAVLAFIFALLIGLLSWLFPATQPPTDLTPTPTPVESMMLPTPAPSGAASETLHMITSSAFWAVALVLTVMAFIFFWRERGISLNHSTWQRLWTAVTQWWDSLWQSLSQQMTATRQAIQARRKRNLAQKGRTLPQAPWRFIRLNALSPRDQLRYFYLSTVERASQRGVDRQESETPLEYARDLKENWPDAEDDVEKLTEAFLQARYSPQPIAAEEVHPIKAYWKRLRARLRRRQ
jgi:hypothetical protein